MNIPKINALDIEASELGAPFSYEGSQSEASSLLGYIAESVFLRIQSVTNSEVARTLDSRYRHGGRLNLPGKRSYFAVKAQLSIPLMSKLTWVYFLRRRRARRGSKCTRLVQITLSAGNAC